MQGDIHQIRRIRIEAATPSLNKFTYAKSPFIQAKAKKEWYWLIRGAPGILDIPRVGPAGGCKRHLCIERHGKRPLDPDNLIGGAKCCIIDNLRKMALLVDDSDEWLELEAINVLLAKGEKPHTILVLRDLDD
jgi:hypothetical protein